MQVRKTGSPRSRSQVMMTSRHGDALRPCSPGALYLRMNGTAGCSSPLEPECIRTIR